MTQPEALHPNLALIASRYDAIIEEMERRMLSPTEARAQIAQLEARDDQGVRWIIDPDSGAFARRTVFGDSEFDTPPQSGVKTLDPYDINTRPVAENPHLRLRTVQTGLSTPPLALAGATQHLNPPAAASVTTRVATALMDLPSRTKAIVVGVIIALSLGAFLSVGGDEADPQPPAPTQQEQPAPADAPAPAKKK